MGLFSFLQKDCSGFPISRGSSGQRVTEVQNALIAQGQNIQADGAWGPSSESAARAVLGTPTVSCDQYRQMAGKGLTDEKVNTAVGVVQAGVSIVDLIKGGSQSTPQPQAPPPPPPEKDNTTMYLAIGGGILVVVVLLVIVLTKK